jgi:plasmid stabilization system protein ParE
VNVEFSDEADALVAEIADWWRKNRRAARDLFTDELERAVANLASMPSIGTTYKPGQPPVKRLLLPRTHHHVYFVREFDRIYIVSVWSCFRGRGPKL